MRPGAIQIDQELPPLAMEKIAAAHHASRTVRHGRRLCAVRCALWSAGRNEYYYAELEDIRPAVGFENAHGYEDPRGDHVYRLGRNQLPYVGAGRVTTIGVIGCFLIAPRYWRRVGWGEP